MTRPMKVKRKKIRQLVQTPDSFIDEVAAVALIHGSYTVTLSSLLLSLQLLVFNVVILLAYSLSTHTIIYFPLHDHEKNEEQAGRHFV